MRIVTVIETGADADIVDQVVLRALDYSDAVLAICHPASDGTRDALVQANRRGLPLVVFDSPGPGAFDRARRLDFCRNVRRFFDPEALVWLGRREWLAAESIHETGGRSATRRLQGDRLGRRILHRSDLAALDGLPRGIECSGDLDRALNTMTLVRARARCRRDGSNIQHSIVPELRVADRLADLLGASPTLLSGPHESAPSPDGSGVLGSEFHLANLYVDYPPFRYLSDKFRPRSVLDVGCGLGAYIEGFKARGAAEGFGLDGFEGAGAVLCPDSYACHDLRQPLDLGRTFDLVVCTEVIEHIDSEFEVTLLDTVRRHAGSRILFSAARPGQPGTGHVNCQPAEHWLAYWRATGWLVNVFDTLAVRPLSTFFWFRRNLFVLQPETAEPVGRCGSSDVKSSEAETVTWVAQPPAVHFYPLECPLPALIQDNASGSTNG
jgi:SAM-dependent methyltransferase